MAGDGRPASTGPPGAASLCCLPSGSFSLAHCRSRRPQFGNRAVLSKFTTKMDDTRQKRLDEMLAEAQAVVSGGAAPAGAGAGGGTAGGASATPTTAAAPLAAMPAARGPSAAAAALAASRSKGVGGSRNSRPATASAGSSSTGAGKAGASSSKAGGAAGAKKAGGAAAAGREGTCRGLPHCRAPGMDAVSMRLYCLETIRTCAAIRSLRSTRSQGASMLQACLSGSIAWKLLRDLAHGLPKCTRHKFDTRCTHARARAHTLAHTHSRAHTHTHTHIHTDVEDEATVASQTLSRDEALVCLMDLFGETAVKGLQDDQWKVWLLMLLHVRLRVHAFTNVHCIFDVHHLQGLGLALS